MVGRSTGELRRRSHCIVSEISRTPKRLAFNVLRCLEREFDQHRPVSGGAVHVLPMITGRPMAVNIWSDTASEFDATDHLYTVTFTYAESSRCYVTRWLRSYSNTINILIITVIIVMDILNSA